MMSLDTNAILNAVKEARGKSKKRNFTQPIELVINLQDIDFKKPEGKIQEMVQLPHPLENKVKVCIIASGELALKAKKSGADLVIEKNELEALGGDKKRQGELANTYDFFIAEAPLMPLIGKVLGSTLGPRGKMPIPVPPTADIASRIETHRKMVAVRSRGQPTIQCRIGTEEMQDEKIAENVQAVIRTLEGKLKRGLKNIRSICIKTSMGQPVKIKV